MKFNWRQRFQLMLEDLRWRLFGTGQSAYRCLTCRLPFAVPIDEAASGTTDAVFNKGEAVDYDVPAFLRKASKKPEEPWPDFPKDGPNCEDENDRFIFVPLADGTAHVVTIPGKTQGGAKGYVW